MDIVTLLILIGATWRLSSLLVNDDGPFNMFAEFRYWIGVRFDENSQVYGENGVAKALTCIRCTSLWVGILLTISYMFLPVYTSWFCLPFALSAGAIYVSR